MRMYSWLQSLNLSLKRASARRPHRVLVQLERLESRIVPVIITGDVAVSGALSVILEPGDCDVSIHATALDEDFDGGSDVVVTVNGVDMFGDGISVPGFHLDAEEVTSIVVDASGAVTSGCPNDPDGNGVGGAVIDLSAVIGDGF